MANVTLEHIKKVYDNQVLAVDDFNLEIQDKEFVVLVGPSGCGKSTTLRMIAGLEEITAGELFIGDRLVNNVAPKDRDIAMVFQNYALYPHMTVFENMAFALKLRKMDKEEIRQRVERAAEILNIEELLQRKPKALSGGQRQRVAIGRAIVREPQVFLMDEPLSNLDAKLRNQMRSEIIKLRQRINTTFVYVTHDQTEAMTLGDRIVIMKDGLIQQVGTPADVYSHPSNMFVAGFIGMPQMNFFKAQLVQDGAYAVEVFGQRIVLSEATQKALQQKQAAAQEIVMGIRPENLTMAEENDAGGVEGTVEVSELMGSEIFFHLDIMGQEAELKVQTVQVTNSALLGPQAAGQKICVNLMADFIHLFDPETEENMI